MTGEYLSNIVDVDDLQENKLNLIFAPCGSGKTTFAKTVMKEVHESYYDSYFHEDMLCLIDTAMGKEQLLHSDGAEEMFNFWTDEVYWKLPGITVMTYSGYQTLCEKAPEKNLWKENSVIICDELQEEILWSKWEADDGLHTRAVWRIAYTVFMTNNLVVALSATPKWIRKEFDFCLNEIPLLGEPRHYDNGCIKNYNNLLSTLDTIKSGERGIIYLSQIDEMKKCNEYLRQRGIRCSAVWSKNSTDKPMTDEQHRLREYIIRHRELPENVDVLILNRACATSITIGEEEKTKRPINFMIIHTADEDLQTQVRGRYRNDLPMLYLHSYTEVDNVLLDRKWLYRKLSKKDRDALCAELGFKDSKGRLMKWPSIRKLIERTYIVLDVRTNKERFITIEEL